MKELEMKDSGLPWINSIPMDFRVEKLKYQLKRRTEKKRGDCEVLSLYRDFGIVPKSSREDNHNVTSSDTSNYLYVREGDFVINKMKAWQGSVAVSGYKGIVSPAYYVYEFISPDLEKKYFHYLLRACYKDEFRRLSGGIREGQWDLSATAFENCKCLIPFIQQQTSIANFLDTKCAEIDSLTADIEKQIETLQEYKKSVITEAVTKGLDPNVEMKMSGCNWIGQIPKTWTESKVKLHLRRRTVRNPSPGSSVVLSLYREYGVIPKNSRDDNHNVTSADTSNYLFVRRGDFVINKMKAWQGSVALSSYEGIVSPAYFVYEFITDQLDKQYLHYLLRSCYKDEFRRLSAGIREGQWDLPAESFSNLSLILPPLKEQIEISQYLEITLPQIDKLIKDKSYQVETLAQYKQSLIYEYVTGKKTVPDNF